MTEDNLWIEFLSSLYDDSLYNDDEQYNDTNDPEYNISQDIDDDWDFKNENAVKVSDYELNLLFDDNEQQNDINIDHINKINEMAISCDEQTFNGQTINKLVEQMIQHIQLLTQTCLQTMNSKTLASISKNANNMLNELNDYSNMKTVSVFKTINLEPSLQLVKEHLEKRCVKTNMLTSWRSLPVDFQNQLTFVNNKHVFVFDCLLPHCGCHDIYSYRNINKSKTVFTPSEDHLIALGLEQFSPFNSLRKCYRYIKQLMLPIKTVDQIRTRIKNLKRRANSSDMAQNPIVFYLINGTSPAISQNIVEFRKTPDWYKKLVKSKKTHQQTGFASCVNNHLKRNKTDEYFSDRKKLHITHKSPVKQKNSIVKKYRYLNRLYQKPAINNLQNTAIFKTTDISSTNEISDFNRLNANLEVIKTKDSVCLSEEKKLNENKILNVCSNSKYLKTSDEKLDIMVEHENQEIEWKSDVQDINDLSAKQFEIKTIHNNDEDMESDLEALMTASSTITIANKNKSKNADISSALISSSHGKKEGRKSQANKHRESTLQLLTFEWNKNDPKIEEKEELLVYYYLEKVRKCMSHDNYVRFLALLAELFNKRNEESKPGIKQLYNEVESFFECLGVDKDLISEFVLFFNAQQAEECGKMFDYLYWKRFFNFVRKLEIYSVGDPQCLQRLIRSLNQLKQNEGNVDKAKIKSALSRVLNGHQYLMHEFSSLFLDEKPSSYLFEDEDFDVINVESSDDEHHFDSSKNYYENINIPSNDEEVKFGTNECPCKACHLSTNNCNAQTGRHCTSCGIKFIGGRVYLMQNNKKLALVDVHYYCDNQTNVHQNKTQFNSENDHNFEEPDLNIESDTENDHINEKDAHQNDSSDIKKWTISEDRVLLELCRSKILDDKTNFINKEIFEEIAQKLTKNTSDVIARFNKLIELFALDQQESSHDTDEI